MTRHAGALGTSALIVALWFPATAPDASAQAFVPRAGEGTVSFLFQNMLVRDHYLTTTRRDFFGPIDTNVLVLDIGYGVTDRLAVDVALPFVISKYSGDYPHPLPLGPVTIDDGRYHGAFQDVRFAVRYSVVRGRTAVTPFVGSFVPSHGYEYLRALGPGTETVGSAGRRGRGGVAGPARSRRVRPGPVFVRLRAAGRRPLGRPPERQPQQRRSGSGLLRDAGASPVPPRRGTADPRRH